ncbi:MAG: MBL fold metallo-hydrolase [Deltaproteobacteria bacterium]|nr:MBL fold metallo-hydrolase [Deltaproteobacteria bacterium]MBW2387999.1 MBL fold metallo-hydrolase [Deltaproteobacteria bacterium]
MKPRRRVLALLIALCFVLAPVGGSAEAELAPAPIDDKGRFTNLDGVVGHGSAGVRFRFFLRRIASSFGSRPGAPARVDNDGAFLRENASHSIPTVTWVGHATLLIQMDHVTFLTDPNWSDTASPVSFAGPPRFVAPGIALDDLPPIDFVLISHNHYDHLDLRTLEALAERDPATRFFVPLANGDLLRSRGIRRVTELDWGEVYSIGEVEIHCLPAQHWSRRGPFDERRALWSSWAVTGPARRFYFGGDTGYFSGFEKIGKALGPFDLAALPIGAYEPKAMMEQSHLNPEQAVVAGMDVRARRLIGIHFGTFDLSDEPLDEPPRRMRAAGRENGFEDDQVWILNVGETREF